MFTSTYASKLERHVTFCGVKTDTHLQRGRQAELDVVQYLVDNLKTSKVGDYRILVNYNMGYEEGALEIDLLVINRYGVFLLEVKDWRGSIQANQDKWILDGKFERKNPLDTLINKSRIFRTRFLDARVSDRNGNLWDWRGVGSAGFIVLRQGADKMTRNLDRAKELIVGLDSQLLLNLNSTLLIPAGNKARLLNDQEILQLRELIYGQYESRKQEIVDNYQILGELSPGELFDAFEAIDLNTPEKHVRLKCYKLNNFRQLPENIEQFKKDATALSKLGSHQNIVQSIRFFPDISNELFYYEVTELVRGDRLDIWMQNYKQLLAFQKQLEIIEQLCDALSYSHGYKNEKGEAEPIIHRNINDTCIYISPTGLVKLADFDFSKILGSRFTVVSLPDTPFTAPEVYRHQAYPESDIYSLGVLWYYLASLPTHPPQPLPENPSLLSQLGIPVMAKNLITQMTAKDHHVRTHSIDELRANLQLLKQK